MPQTRWTALTTCFCILLPLVVLSLFLWASPFSRVGDLWLHLKMGEAHVHNFFETGQLLTSDIFTYSEFGKPNELHSWLGQITLWAIHLIGGIGLLIVLKALLLLAAFGMAFRYYRDRSGHLPLFAVLLSLWILLQRETYELRPALFGEFFFFLFAFGFLRIVRPLKKRALVLAALCLIVWVNFHASALIILPVVFFFSFSLYLKGGRKKVVLLYPVGALLALLAHPLGWQVFATPIKIAQKANLLEVGEWAGLKLSFSAPSFILIGLGIGVLFQFFRFVKQDSADRLYQLLCLALFTGLPFVSVRHLIFIPFALIMLGRDLGGGLEKFDKALGIRPWIRNMGQVSAVVCILVGARAWQSLQTIPSPVKAVQFLKEAGLSGNVFNYHPWGGYILFNLYPQFRTVSDVRIALHHSFFDRLRNSSIRTGVVDFDKVMANYPETDLILHKSSIPLQRILGEEWVTLYENSLATILLRRSSSNRVNFGKVEGYYRRRGVPFGRSEGFVFRQALKERPQWVRKNSEALVLGKWPQEESIRQWLSMEARFYMSRR